jgi:hypothetical protein
MSAFCLGQRAREVGDAEGYVGSMETVQEGKYPGL